ncbi:MAG: hypothetical protein NC213_09750 [Acetobacter sp.]|nr:hypothetical protein [Bacteroides sp.]MCM1342015.1 hypothetical protein [Acetobacter sp.]MCM1434188.1 hypothetical protein [Clostridiales bacterium]
MDKKRAAELINKYKKQKRLIKFLVVLVFIELIALPVHIAARLAAAFILIVIMYLLSVKINSNIKNIIFMECDPALFYAVIKEISPAENIINDILTAELIGDYQKGIELSVKGLKLVKNKKIAKIFYLESLTKLAFEGGDFELCQKYCNEILSLINSIKLKEDDKNGYAARAKFYIDFINCDYDCALAELNVCMNIQNQANSYKAVMQYYLGLVNYYSSKDDSARVCFEYVCSNAPKLKIAEFSQEYIDAIDNSTFKVLETSTYNTEFEEYKNDKKTQMPVWKIIFLALCAVVLIICGVQISGINKGAMPEVLTKDADYELIGSPALFDIDENYCLCVYETSEHNTVVAYLEKLKDDKYIIKADYQSDLEEYINDNAEQYLCADGKSSKVIFDISNDKNKIPENKVIKEFTADGDQYYLYYSVEKAKYHYFSSSGINIKQ